MVLESEYTNREFTFPSELRENSLNAGNENDNVRSPSTKSPTHTVKGRRRVSFYKPHKAINTHLSWTPSHSNIQKMPCNQQYYSKIIVMWAFYALNK
jgi:hypothetical protein